MTCAGAVADRSDELRAGVAASFEAAGSASVVRLDLADDAVELRFAGESLRDRLTPAFAHVVDPRGDRPPALTINLWDTRATGSEPPPRPPVPAGHAEGALYHFEEGSLRGVYRPGLEALSVLDGDAGVAWHWVADAREQPYWDEACPLRQILFWWLRSRGYLQVHGAAVGTQDGGVLVVGKGGSGKSTVALSALGTDLLYGGDDYVAVGVEPEPRVQSLYSSGKLEPEHVQDLLPHLAPLLANADRLATEKAVLYVHEHFPEQTTSGFPLSAVLVPRVRADRPDTRVVGVSRAEAFAALAPSTILQLHTADQSAFATMSQLVARVPCYGLEVGRDVAAVPRAVADFLAGLSSR